MSDQERLLSSLKKQVRSLLTAAQGGLTPAELTKDYKSMIGEQLPFRALGYQSAMELLKDMPDVVNIRCGKDGSIVLKAIADRSTMELASLVARQKSKTRSQFPRMRSKVSFGYAYRPAQPWQTQKSGSFPWRGRVPPTLPAAVKSQLKELLRSSPVLLSDFNKAFANHFGQNFEFGRYGFFSMSEVLKATADVITVVQTRAGSMLTLKKNPPPTNVPENLPQPKVVIQPTNKAEQTLPPTGAAPTVDTCPPTPSLHTQNQNQTPSQESKSSLMQLKPQEAPMVEWCDKMKHLQKQMKTALVQRGPGGMVSSELKEKIKTIAAQYPEGLLVSRLPGEFEVQFKEPLPVRELGFLNLNELVGALSDILRIEHKEGEQDCRIFDIDSQCLGDDEETDHDISLSGSLAHEEASDEPELPCWDFPSEDSKNLVATFNVVTKIVKPHLDLEEFHVMQEIMKEEIPPDAVQGRTLHCLPQLETGALVALSVEFMVSPSQFYVQICSAETSEKLEDMMIEMRRCYASKIVADRYIIPDASVKPGHPCCVRNFEDKWWYRGIIHRVVNDQQVEIFYLDFGNMEIVPKSHLRLLKECYADLPAQAIPCCLSQTKPAKGDWTSGAILEFQRLCGLCGLKPLVGVVDEYVDGILHLFLCDTSSEEDIYFHNVLRLGGYSVICGENIPSKGFRELNPSALYLKPSPEEHICLENGDVSLFQQESQQDLPEALDVSAKKSSDCQARNACRESPENSRLVPEEKTLQTKDPSSLFSAPLPDLEPVSLCTEIWDENCRLSVAEEEKGDTFNNLCSDVTVFSSQSWNNEERNNEAQHSQELEPQTTESLGIAADRLSQTLEEFYDSIGPSQQSDLNANKLLDSNPQSLPELSAFPVDECKGEVPSKTKEDNVSRTQLVPFTAPSPSRVQEERGHNNALAFTAELQGSPVFCIPYCPSAALGASARLATSGKYFFLSQRMRNL
ncbi:tudor domain-containing protein 5 isoform X3 [Sphaerodactylus townsendi]|uniref:tudor domain-containing protein 5 isoform X3 n=2 Tax=Sphaerodactylus townsendi TaxID=933632 RepID=UPI002026BEEA|nr:tudor domain-containing protein 5 isoform X3 [Sphaerodactylus townsendi]